jgi:ferredoxin
MTSGPTSVVEAMASGRGAAASIDRFIQGKPLTLERILRPGEPLNAEADFRLARRHSRAAVRRLPPAQRRTSFEIVEAAYDASTARREADRCLRCGKAMEFYGECWYCLPCEVECPTKALTLEIPYLVR